MTQLSRRKFVGAVGAGVAALAVGGSAAAKSDGNGAIARFDNVPNYPPSPSKANTWQVKVGVESKDMSIDGMLMLPNQLWINAGDTVTWTFDTMEAHTVTIATMKLIMGGGAPDPDSPPSGGSVLSDPINGFYNSGAINGMSKPNSYSLTFPIEGDYRYACLFHDSMIGYVHVAPKGTPYRFSQAVYDRQAWLQADHALEMGNRMISEAEFMNQQDANRPVVIAGYGNGYVSLMRFFPETIVVHRGDVVTWTTLDSGDPHDILIGPEPDQLFGPIYPGAPTSNADAGPQKAPADYDGDPNTTLYSGTLAFFMPWGNTFRVRFTKTGTFPYKCSIHDDMGMTGKVVVVP